MSGPDYLFDGPADRRVDGAASPDPEVEALERLLGRFGHDGRALGRRRRRRIWPFLVALAAAAVVVTLALGWRSPKQAGPETLRLARGAGGEPLGVEEWFEATDTERELTLDDHAYLTLAPGSRLQVRRLDADQSRFFLATGQLEAFVFPSVRARFFQVETPATTCVDLGCRYTLDVDPETGDAQVRVTMGQVAFVDGEREVFVPRHAECRAVRGRGAGTPRFSDCAEELRTALDRYDETSGAERSGHGRRAATLATTPRDTLPLWHLLADADAGTRRAAEEALVRVVGMPVGSKGTASLAAWRAHLDPSWW